MKGDVGWYLEFSLTPEGMDQEDQGPQRGPECPGRLTSPESPEKTKWGLLRGAGLWQQDETGKTEEAKGVGGEKKEN